MALFIELKSIGDASVIITITGTGGLEAKSFFRRAGQNEGNTAGTTRTGDGDLTVTGLTNRVPFDITVQTDDGFGSLGPASNVLLLTPRASGTSDLNSIILELKSQLEQVANIGEIHERRRHTVFWDKFYKRHAKDGRVNNWEITRSEFLNDINAVQGALGAEPTFHDTHGITIFGHMSLNEKTKSEDAFQLIIDGIILRLQLNNRLNNAVILPHQIQAAIIDHATLGGVLCHTVEMTYEATARVGG